MARGRLGEDGVGLAGLPLIHDRSCAWTRCEVSLGGGGGRCKGAEQARRAGARDVKKARRIPGGGRE